MSYICNLHAWYINACMHKLKHNRGFWHSFTYLLCAWRRAKSLFRQKLQEHVITTLLLDKYISGSGFWSFDGTSQSNVLKKSTLKLKYHIDTNKDTLQTISLDDHDLHFTQSHMCAMIVNMMRPQLCTQCSSVPLDRRDSSSLVR